MRTVGFWYGGAQPSALKARHHAMLSLLGHAPELDANANQLVSVETTATRMVGTIRRSCQGGILTLDAILLQLRLCEAVKSVQDKVSEVGIARQGLR